MDEHATPFGEIHLVAIDLDGTLLQPDMRLSDRARNAILANSKDWCRGRHCKRKTLLQFAGDGYPIAGAFLCDYLQWCGNSPFARWGADLGIFPIPGRS